MVAQDFFFYSLGLGFLILVGFLAYAIFCISRSFNTLNLVLKNALDVSDDISDFEKGLKFKLRSLLQIFFKKRG